MDIIVILVFQSIICAIFSGVLANEKQLDTGIWVLAGLIFGIFGLIAAAGMPPKLSSNNLNEPIKCPKCNTTLIQKENNIAPLESTHISSEKSITNNKPTSKASYIVGGILVAILISMVIINLLSGK